jgi:AraC family transcriptional regulator
MSKILPSGSFYGNVNKTCRFDEFTFVEMTYSPGLRVPRHRHLRPYFYLVLEGDCTETYENKVRSVGPLTLVFHSPEGAHEDHWQRAGGRCFGVEFADSRMQGAREHVRPVEGAAYVRSGDPVWLATRLHREFQSMDDVSPLAMEGLTLEILAAISRASRVRPKRKTPRWLVDARELLRDRFTERLVLDEIAAAVDIHPVHLCRAFRNEYGCTIGEYVRRLRVDFAAQRLSTSQDSLVEISLAAGFSDQSHFTKAFRRCTGMTPGAFRLHLRSR